MNIPLSVATCSCQSTVFERPKETSSNIIRTRCTVSAMARGCRYAGPFCRLPPPAAWRARGCGGGAGRWVQQQPGGCSLQRTSSLSAVQESAVCRLLALFGTTSGRRERSAGGPRDPGSARELLVCRRRAGVRAHLEYFTLFFALGWGRCARYSHCTHTSTILCQRHRDCLCRAGMGGVVAAAFFVQRQTHGQLHYTPPQCESF